MARYVREAERERMRELRYVDGLSAREVAKILGRSERTVLNHAPGKPGKIPVAPVREAFLRSGISAADLARKLGWTYPVRRMGPAYMAADTGRVRRALGINEGTTTMNGRRYRCTAQTIDAEIAERIADALGIARWEVGA